MADYMTPKIPTNTNAGGNRAKCETEGCDFALSRECPPHRVWPLSEEHLDQHPTHMIHTDQPMAYYKDLCAMDQQQDREASVWPREAIEKAQADEEAPEGGEVTGGPVPASEGEPRGATPLEQWWRGNTESEIAWLVPKAEEYGGMHRASDLVDLGRTMADLMGRDPGEYSEGALQELGIYFYLEGKLGRWKAAILENRGVSEDTMIDISVYARMALRSRQSGGWPV